MLAGLWVTPGTRAESDLDGADQVAVQSLSCADCSVQARVVNFAAGFVALDLRASASNDRYDVALQGNGHLQIRRTRGGTTTVLGDVASGIADLGNWATIGLSATGSGPVQLVASVNGTPKLTVTDSSSSAIPGPGTAGMSASLAGIWFDDFVVKGAGTGGGSDGGVPDAGTPDAGTPDAGTPDAGTPDAGTPDAGTPDAGIPDAGTPDAGAPDAGPPDGGAPPPQTGVLFTDDFNRTLSSGLGPKWSILSGAWRDDNRANSDLDTLDRAAAAGAACADCRIDAKMVNFGGGESMLELRVSGNDRYALALTAGGALEIRRYRAGVETVLGSVGSGIADLTEWHSFAFAVQGSSALTLTASVDGVPKISATDSSASALTFAGASGIAATVSGILFDDFTLTGSGTVDNPPPPDAGTPDAGTPDAGTPDAGTPDAGADGGTTLSATVTYTETGFGLMAVDPGGRAYGVNLNSSGSEVWTTVDGRSWSKRGVTAGDLQMMTALSDGTLIADLAESSGHVLARSTDHGATWTDVLSAGQYRMLTPHSIAELGGAVYFVEYQVFTIGSTPIRLWKSTDRGATWNVQFTFQGHRHGHGLMPDPARNALFAFFGDTDVQSALYRSTDGGASWALIVGGRQTADIVDGVVLSDGSFLCGLDVSYHGSTPDTPQIAHIALDGTETDYLGLPSASYSTHAISGGGYVVGTTHEEGADVEAPGWNRGALFGSGDGVHWRKLLEVPQAAANEDVRTDVYWELATGELVLSVWNAAGFGPGGRGYMLLLTTRQ